VDSNGGTSLFNGNNFVFDRRRLGENDNNENNS
jgi:predicted sulfurtransferase